MHKVTPEVQATISIPIIHIAEMTAQALIDNQISRVGLLGTKYTMEQDFYKQVLIDQGIEVLTPEKIDRELVNQVIYEELCLGQIQPASKKQYLRIIADLKEKGAQGVILGCTEIGLLIQQVDTEMVLFDTTMIHAKGAALKAIQ